MGKNELIYFVGFLDGEGYVGVKKVKPSKKSRQKNPVYNPTISVGNTNKKIMKWIKDNFGGHYMIEKLGKANCKTFYKIELTKPIIRLYIDDFIKYSIVKKRQLILLKEILEMKSIPCKYGGRDEKELNRFNQIYQELLNLNKRGL